MAYYYNNKRAIAKYESFVNDVLKDDLRKLDNHMQKVTAEISDLIQQKQSLKVVMQKEIHPAGFKSQVNIGCNFFMEASVQDTSKVLVNIGLNNYLELTLDEANNYLDTRIEIYEKKSEAIRQKTAETKANIKLMLFGIGELYNLE